MRTDVSARHPKELRAQPEISRAFGVTQSGSKPMVPFWGRCTTHLVENGMFTGGTIWMLTHGHVDQRGNAGFHFRFPPPTWQLYVGGLDFSVRDSDLLKAFTQRCDVEKREPFQRLEISAVSLGGTAKAILETQFMGTKGTPACRKR